MFKGTISGTSTTGNIAFEQVIGSNPITRYDATNNQLNIYGSGYFDVKVLLNCSNVTAGDVSAQLYANGTALADSKVTTTATTGDEYALSINDVIRVEPTSPDSVAALSVRMSVAGETINNGILIVERRK